MDGENEIIFLSFTGNPKVRMAPASEKRLNAKGNKYIVYVTSSSSSNRRFLVFILVAVALVAFVVLLSTLIPTYMKGSGEENSSGK